MIDRKRRYNIQTETPYPHTGMLLKKYIKDNNISRIALAKKMEVSYSTLGNYFDQQSIQMGIIWKLSLATGYNFLAAIAENLPIPYLTKEAEILQLAAIEKDKKIEDMEKELVIYRRILDKKEM